jgi:hypothetical protein
MKRQGNLYPKIIAFENLLISARQAQRSKRFRPNVLEFNFHLEAELEQLQQDYDRGKITWEQINQSHQSWDAHLQHGDTHRLRQDISAKWTPIKLT